MLKKYILLLFFFSTFQSFATHIVGGEIYYDCLGGNKYYVTLKQYLDCCPTCTSYDDEASVAIYNSKGQVVKVMIFPLLHIKNVPPTLYTKCFTMPLDICVQEIIYGDTLDLPPIPGGYLVSYQRCCRNADILNVVDADHVGSTYQAFIDPLGAGCNNSPRYKNLPPLLLCVGVPFVFDNSASDPDGDSIYYEMCSPFEGADPFLPMPDTSSVPPYVFVSYNPPYSGAYPIESTPAFSIDHKTGIITGTPTMIGRWVVGICAKEYRNGVLLSTNTRDYQFNVTFCPKSASAFIKSQTVFCDGLKMNFSQQSTAAFSYHWDFGDPTTNADTSNYSSPSWTYADTGSYTVTLIINQFAACADTATMTVKIQGRIQPFFIPPSPKCMYEINEGFVVGGTYPIQSSFSWEFGPKATPSNVGKKDPGKIIFSAGGLYPITLTISKNNCVKKYTDTLRVHLKPKANYELNSPVLCQFQPVQFINLSYPDTMNYLWVFGDETTSKDKNPIHTYKKEGSYIPKLFVSTDKGCKDSLAVPLKLEIHKLPTAGFDVTPKDTSVFYSTISVTDLSINKKQCQLFWGDGTPEADCDKAHLYTTPGTYQITQIVDNEGCLDTAYAEVIVRPEFVFWLPNAFTPGEADGLNDVFKPTLFGVHQYRFMIFDRWGQKIFETTNPSEGWNGFLKGRLCEADVYVYKIIFRDDVRMMTHQYLGHVTLVR